MQLFLPVLLALLWFDTGQGYPNNRYFGSQAAKPALAGRQPANNQVPTWLRPGYKNVPLARPVAGPTLPRPKPAIKHTITSQPRPPPLGNKNDIRAYASRNAGNPAGVANVAPLLKKMTINTRPPAPVPKKLAPAVPTSPPISTPGNPWIPNLRTPAVAAKNPPVPKPPVPPVQKPPIPPAKTPAASIYQKPPPPPVQKPAAPPAPNPAVPQVQPPPAAPAAPLPAPPNVTTPPQLKPVIAKPPQNLWTAMATLPPPFAKALNEITTPIPGRQWDHESEEGAVATNLGGHAPGGFPNEMYQKVPRAADKRKKIDIWKHPTGLLRKKSKEKRKNNRKRKGHKKRKGTKKWKAKKRKQKKRGQDIGNKSRKEQKHKGKKKSQRKGRSKKRKGAKKGTSSQKEEEEEERKEEEEEEEEMSKPTNSSRRAQRRKKLRQRVSQKHRLGNCQIEDDDRHEQIQIEELVNHNREIEKCKLRCLQDTKCRSATFVLSKNYCSTYYLNRPPVFLTEDPSNVLNIRKICKKHWKGVRKH